MISWFVTQASSYAPDVDGLILLIGLIIAPFFLAAEFVLVWLVFKFRARPGVKARYITGEKKSETKWVHYPHYLVLVFDIIIVAAALRVWSDVKMDLPPADERVRIIAQQWAWTFVHAGPDGQLDTADDIRTVNALNLQVNRLYHYELHSKDVLHSFSVPAFRLKQDAVPGTRDRGVVPAHGHRRVRSPVRRDLWDRTRADAGACPDSVGGRTGRLDGDGAANAAACLRDARRGGHGCAIVARRAGGQPSGCGGSKRTRPADVDRAGVPAAHACAVGWRAPRGRPMSGLATQPVAHHHRSFVKTYLWSTDHKVIAMQYLFTGMFMALIGGFAVYVFRMQLAFPGHRRAAVRAGHRPGEYNSLVTNARHDHDLLGRDAGADRRVRELPDPADDRLRRHGVPAG